MTPSFAITLRRLASAGCAVLLLAAAAAPESTVATDSPRASVERFLAFSRAGHWAEAAQYLEVPPERRGDGEQLARRLSSILDRSFPDAASLASPAPDGDTGDGLEPGVDRLASSASQLEPVLLVRRSDESGARWLFARSTVERVDASYAEIEGHWLAEQLPAPLLRPGPRGLLWWQWIALPLFALLALGLGLLLGRITRAVLGHMARRTPGEWDDQLVARLGAPIAAAWALGVFWAASPALGLPASAEELLFKTLRAGLFVVFFWSLWRGADIWLELLVSGPWAKDKPAARAMVPLAGRIGKVVLFAVAVVAVLSELGYPVASLIAGLGIGGIALALAGQKTVENLFGAFAIGVDQPFREGDFVQVDGVQGTVEQVGLRSTRIRTPDRTLVTIPNGKLAELRIESFAARDRMRLFLKLGLLYGTTAAQLRAVLAGIEKLLAEHPQVWPEGISVRFTGLGVSALEIEVAAWFKTDAAGFLLVRQELLLQIMETVERAGTGFAFPTTTVQLEGAAPRAEGEGKKETAAAG